MIKNFTKDKQNITADWEPINASMIEGVEFKEIRNVIKDNGYLTEMFRSEWFDNTEIGQVFRVHLQPGAISAWHAHAITVDRLSIIYGAVKVVLFDARPDSPTAGKINEFKLSEHRPGTVLIPPGVWHGVQNINHNASMILNMVDKAYVYENPDHLRIDFDDPQIPYTFEKRSI
ncbi:dTDP-4-dehydrorhamnose 3,5-epimerase family protein [Pedobacter nyackensis]|uniref:dTDP-4-dehydrorhamnose 3,5-epimerase n=1 Tax=Pedobacter nyackensis TaxID=475255 RepID=A0A1W2C4Z4_9SPHI|nr:dTDP-4-dehydrorhamnose 3,5-epimerase family protein [Pedobacter nyackensis]SMC80279.1 dTDP-4-dehydrorhamnose 3,5-epimerase [Pedobacter nyackensis]